EDVKFSNIYVLHRGGGTEQDSANNPPELENAYPEPNRFGPMPAQGFFIRHVKGIAMSDVEIRSTTADLRPAFVLNDVDGADSSRIRLPKGCSPAWVLNNVRDFNLAQSRPFPDTYLESVTQKSL